MNFVIFMPDEMRAESIGCYGHPLISTPNIDRLAAEGVRFDQCHVQHTVCGPSRCSMMTGWYPHVNGHRTLWHLLRPHEPHLFKYLHAAGYNIRWCGKNDLLSEEEKAAVVTPTRRPGNRKPGKPLYNYPDPEYYAFLRGPFPGESEDHHDYADVQAGIEFLQSNPQEPFCLYLPLSSPHPPYSAPQPWHDMYDRHALPALRPANLPGKPKHHALIRHSRQLDHLDEAMFKEINAVYLGMISYMDFLLGRVLTALDETGLAKNTTVIFCSDHGDWAGDWGLVEKWPSALDDTLTRIPLIIRTPGGTSGHVVREQVELFDVMATCMELAGLSCSHTHFARSLVPQLQGAPGDPERAVFAEGGYDPHEPHCFEGRVIGDQAGRGPEHIYYPKGRLQQSEPSSVSRTVMIRTLNYKLIYRTADVCELYHLAEDPQELRNVYEEPAYEDVRRRLESQLLAWYLHTSDVVPWDEDKRN
ncbi:MAG: sulfatase-like hydrolase/transferase [Limnochordia bacterium]|jgi:arylsulfatase A-like enzyme